MTTSRTMLRVACRFFGRYAEVLATERLEVTIPAGGTVGEAVAAARRQLANGHLLPERPLVAVNREHVALDRPLAPGDEVAFLPPLAGG